MTDRELMQMALDALNNFDKGNHGMRWQVPVIKALRARLLNEFNPDWDAMSAMVEEQQRMAKRIEELEAALAQPEQEPVAWISHNAGLYHGKPDESLNPLPLYTTTPQREVYCGCGDEIVAGDGARCGTCVAVKYKEKEWISLTDEEHMQIAIDCGCLGADWVFYGAAVERKLKEKNND